MAAINMKTKTCYHLNSQEHLNELLIHEPLRKTVDLALELYAKIKDSTEEMNFRWVDVQCPKQKGLECGYNVALFMKYVAVQGCGVLDNNFGGMPEFSDEEIDVFRDEWASIVTKLILN